MEERLSCGWAVRRSVLNAQEERVFVKRGEGRLPESSDCLEEKNFNGFIKVCIYILLYQHKVES